MSASADMTWKHRFKMAVKPYALPVLMALPPELRFHLFGRWRTPQSHVYIKRSAVKSLKAKFNEMTRRPPRQGAKTIWFLPGISFSSAAIQRPHQMAIALHEMGHRVVYFELLQIWQTTHIHELGTLGLGEIREIKEDFFTCRLSDDLIAELMDEHNPDVAVMIWPDQEKALSPSNRGELLGKGRTKIVYDIVDDHSLVPDAGEEWHATHNRIVRNATLVTVTADDLLRSTSRIRPDAVLMPNGVRLEDWRGRATTPVPEDMTEARKAPVVVGYYGAIAGWFDWDMWLGAARERPDWAFVMIGFPYQPEDAVALTRAVTLPNVHYLGKKPYAELASYLAHFDVASIPFRLNDITHACSPVKLFEYLAGGKPVVASQMREVLKYGSLTIAGDHAEFVRAVETLTSDPDAKSAAIAADAEANTWASRASLLITALNDRETRETPALGKAA